jgi:hypothetical protein
MRGAVPPLPHFTSLTNSDINCSYTLLQILSLVNDSTLHTRDPSSIVFENYYQIFYVFDRYLDETKFSSVEHPRYIFRAGVIKPVYQMAGNLLQNYTVSQSKNVKAKLPLFTA